MTWYQFSEGASVLRAVPTQIGLDGIFKGIVLNDDEMQTKLHHVIGLCNWRR